MTTDVLVLAKFADVDGDAADTTVTTFAFHSADPAACMAAVESFYHTAHGSVALEKYLSGTISRAAASAEAEAYDISGHLDGSPHGSPIGGIFWTPAGATSASSNLPDQAAAVMTYAGDLTGGLLERGPVVTEPTTEAAIDSGAPTTHMGNSRPKARHRGRIFFGPLNVDCITTSSSDVHLNDSFAADLGACGSFLIHAGVGWSVWSRRNAILYAVASGHVNGEFGIIRRRKDKVRTKYPVFV